MIRRLMASTAVLALITAGAFGIAEAQTEPAEQPAAAQQDATSTDQGAAPAGDAAATSEQPADATATAAAGSDATLTPERPTIATAFIGQSVFSSEDPDSDNIGDVKDLIISDDGMITHAVVGVGGFLGIGEKEVAVPFDELQVVEDEDGDIRLIYAATREQLEAAEPFDRATYDPEERAAEEQRVAAEAEAEAGGAAGGITPAPTGDMATAPVPAEQPEAEAEESAEVTAAEPAEGEAETTTEVTAAEPATDAAAGTEQQTTAEVTTEPAAGTDQQQTTAEATTEPAAGTDQQQTTAEVTTEPAAGTDQQQTAQVETEAAAGTDQQQMAQTEAGAAFDAESGFVSFSADQVRASTLMGQEVFGPDDESIGEVSDLVLQQDGETRAALIDVGGFLGVGEKEIAVPFDQIEVQPGQNGEEPRLTVAMTREELEQLPAWEDPADMAEADQTGAATTETVVITEQPEQPQGQDAQTAEAEAGEAEQPMPAGQMAEVGSQDLSAENLIGAAIYSPEDETVGEVGDVIFDQGGSIQAVIVDVGGFLGVGEKPVAIQFDALNVQKDTNGDLRLMVNATQEQLENAPAYEVEDQPAQ